MTSLANLTTSQLKNIITIKEQIEALQSQLDSIVADGGEIPIPVTDSAAKKRRMSAAGRARIAAAQRARWAKVHGATDANEKPAKVKRKLSAAHKKKLIKALAKARRIRWGNAKAVAPKPAKKGKHRMSAAGRAAIRAAVNARWAKVRAAGKTKL